jgi:hypothetical protein
VSPERKDDGDGCKGCDDVAHRPAEVLWIDLKMTRWPSDDEGRTWSMLESEKKMSVRNASVC